MDHIETDHYNPTEFIHSMRNVNRDTNKKKKHNKKKKDKKLLKNKNTKNLHEESLEQKGSQIDVVIE